MVELLMEHYGITYERAVELMNIPVIDAAIILQGILEAKKQGKTEN